MEDLANTKDELKSAQRRPRKFNSDKKSTRDDGCHNCGEKGHFARTCPKKKEDGQDNESQRLDLEVIQSPEN